MITVGLYGIQDAGLGHRPTWTHDHSLAVMRDGLVQTVVQLERHTGVKHDNTLPWHVCDLLDRLVPADEPVRFVSVNSFAGNGFASADGRLRIEPDARVTVEDILMPARCMWLPDRLKRREAEAWIMCHEFAHVASILPFIGQFPDACLLVHIDGGASDSACSFWTVEGGKPRLLYRGWDDLKDEVNFFNVGVLGQLALGLTLGDHLSMPGKLMGFAALGRARPELLRWLDARGWFVDHDGDVDALRREIAAAFPTAAPLDALNPLLQDLCACLQHRFQSRVVQRILDFQAQTGAKTLCYAGGAALNIATNVLLEQCGAFDEVWVPPCANDTGLALGAAAWLETRDLGRLPTHGPFLHTLDAPTVEPGTQDLDAILDLLAAGKVVGVCNGAGEVGPRALGHRSILARADSVAVRRRVSEDIKQREWYRPVAPVVTEEIAQKAFGSEVLRSRLAPWMLGAYAVRPTWQSHFAGVLHLDGTVRVQVVRRDDPGQLFLHTLLTRAWRDHGIAGFLNTSFNRQGQPILQRHADAVSAARDLGLDAVVVHGSLHRP